MNRERIAEAQERAEELEAAIAQGKGHLTELERQRAELAGRVAQENEERAAQARRIAELEEALESCARTIEGCQGEMARAQEGLLEATGSQVQVKNSAAKSRQEVTRLESRLSRLQMETAKVTGERREVGAQVRGLEENLLQVRTVLEGMEDERRICRENQAATESALETLRREVQALEQERTRACSQLEILRGLLAAHEGYSSGVKELLTALESGTLPRAGVAGVLAELIQIQPSDAATVDAALGPWAEAVVVDSLEAADRCRRFLEQARAGRVLFLIRERIPPKIPTPVSLFGPAAGQATALTDRIGITPHLAPLIQWILADTWLVPGREAALALLEGVRGGQPTDRITCRFVTPPGEMVTACSLLAGSAPSEEGLVVGRVSRLQSLEVGASHLEQRLEEAGGRLKGLEGERQAQAEAIAVLEASVQGRSEELHRLEATISSAQAGQEKLEQELRVLETEREEVTAELAQARQELARWEEDLAARDRQVEAFQSTIQKGQETIARAAGSREESSVELAKAKAELESFDEVAASRRDSLRLLERSIESARAQERGRAEELARLLERRSDWERACGELERALADGEGQQRRLEEEVERADSARRQVVEQAQGQEREFLAVRRKLEKLQGDLHAGEMELAQVDFQREQIASRLDQLYQIRLEEAETPEGSDPAGSDPEQLREHIQELSQKLQRMGPVNLGSIEEELELQNRFDYLTTQQADLLKAKEDMHQVITRINRTTRAMFRETFQKIQKEFQATFKQLFGGGEARLILMDEEDLLESGIEIIARPPGKPLQPISLLSGGEKALTTIALLFAIFRIKPSPFCLLDEIDAPLDESNIGRFTTALRGFLKDSQFIIITHNKKTISMADVMYGITMEERGVSKIVSVKFNGNGRGQTLGSGSTSSS